MDGLFRLRASVAGLVLLLSACGVPSSPSALKTLGEPDNGATITLPVNGTIDLRLAGNPTTGFTWDVSAIDTAIIKEVGDPEYVADTSATGSGGTLTFHFAAVALGQTTVQLIYHRPFEKDVPPAKTFEFTVSVK